MTEIIDTSLEGQEDNDNKEEQIETENPTTKFFEDIIEKEKYIEITCRDGEKIKGRIEWFDRWNIKLKLLDGKECLIYRHAVKGYSAC